MKLRSRLVHALVSAVLVATMAAPAASAQSAPFKDAAGMTWALPSIQAVSLLGVMQGTGEGLFDPAGTTTRAEMAVVLARLLRWPTGTQGSQVVQGTSFNDWSSVPDWARSAIAIAASRGIIQGESDGGVHPNAPVTWAQLAVIADRAFGYPPAPGSLAAAYRASLPQAAGTPAWALSAVAADVQAGDFGGILGSLYQPNQPVSRAALAVFLAGAGRAAGNPDLLAGRIAAVTSGELVLRTAGGVKVLPVAGGAAVYAGTSPSALASVQVGDAASVVLAGGQVAWIDVTSRPEGVTVAGTVVSAGKSGIALSVPGGGTVTLPVSASLAVTAPGAGSPPTIASLTAGTPVLATVDGHGRIRAIEVTGSAAAQGSTTSSTSSGTSTGSAAAPGSTGSSTSSGTSTGSAAAQGSTTGSAATSGSSGSGSPGTGTSASTTVTTLEFSPDPIAANASLSAGATVDVTLDALNAAGKPVPGAVVQMSFSAGPGGGSASVGGTLLTAAAQSFVADSSGAVQLVYTAPTAPTGAGSDALVATSVAGNTTVAASDSYVYKAYPTTGSSTTPSTTSTTPSTTSTTPSTTSTAPSTTSTTPSNASAVASYTFAPSPIASAASIAPGQSVTVTLTAEDATGGPVGTSIVYLSFAQEPGGGTAWVGSTALASTPQPFLTDSSGHVSITYTAPASPPTGATDTITAADAASNATLTATDSYSFGAAPTGVAPYGTFTASIQSVSGTGLKLLLPSGSTASLILAPGATVDENGQQVGPSALAVGEQVTVKLNGQEWIDAVQIVQSNSLGSTPTAGYLTSVDTTAGTVTIYGSGGLHTYWLAQNPSVTLGGAAATVSQIPIGDSLSLTLDTSSFVTGIDASPPAQVTSGKVVSVVSNVLTLMNGSTPQSIVLGQYTVAVSGGQLVPATSLPSGTPVVIVPGAATYGGMLIIAT